MRQKNKQTLLGKMTGMIDNGPVSRRIEIFGLENLPEKIERMDYVERTVKIKTWIRDAEKVAFNKVRKSAKELGSKLICYVSWSGANPDFMNGTERTPHYYDIKARLYI